MKVLYGVNGEGMGHATRSEVVIDALLERHDVRVVAGGAAFKYLSGRQTARSPAFSTPTTPGSSSRTRCGTGCRWSTNGGPTS